VSAQQCEILTPLPFLSRVYPRDGYIPRPSATGKHHLAMFEWLGRLIAVGYLAHVRLLLQPISLITGKPAAHPQWSDRLGGGVVSAAPVLSLNRLEGHRGGTSHNCRPGRCACMSFSANSDGKHSSTHASCLGPHAGIDQYCGQTLDELRSARGLSEATFEDIIFEKFTTVLSDGTLIPLKVRRDRQAFCSFAAASRSPLHWWPLSHLAAN
jgi:hypothetical protein